jgi:anti-anti-sigma factor
MEITQDTSGDLLEMRLKGALDNESSIHFRTAIEEVTRDGWHRILVDLENLSYISSAGINALLLASKRIKSLKGQFGAHSPPPSVAKVLRLTKLYDVLIIDPADFRIDDTSTSMIMNVSAKRFTRNRAIDLELYSLQPSEPMTCSIYGSPGILHCATPLHSELTHLGSALALCQPRPSLTKAVLEKSWQWPAQSHNRQAKPVCYPTTLSREVSLCLRLICYTA